MPPTVEIGRIKATTPRQGTSGISHRMWLEEGKATRCALIRVTNDGKELRARALDIKSKTIQIQITTTTTMIPHLMQLRATFRRST